MEKMLPTKANILIVDDDVLIAESTKSILRRANYNIVGTAINAAEAIQFARERNPDLILMDINLGNSEDGISAAEEIQKFADIPFIFATAYSDNATIERAKKIGPFGYLIKPYDNREMLVAIETSLYKHFFDKKIKEQELLFRTVANYAYEWEYWQMPDAQFKYCSPSSERITGYKSEEFVRNPKLLFEIIHPEDKYSFEKHFDESHSIDKDKVLNKFEFRILNKHGKIIYIRHTCTPIYDDQNNYLGRRVTNVDITELKQAEETLRISNLRYEKLFTKAEDGIIILSNKGKIISVNESFAKMHGYTIDEMLKMDLHDLYIPETAKLLNEKIARVLSGESMKFEAGHYHKDGHIIYLEVTTSSITLGNEIVIQAFHRDITDRIAKDEELRKLYKAIEQSQVSIIITNLEAKIEYVNPKFTEVTGYTFEEALGQNPRIFKSGETPAEEYRKMWDKLTSGVMWTGVFHNKKKNGELFWESANISPIKNDKNEITHYVAVKEDITDKVEKENELRKYREHLEELVEEKTAQVKKQNLFFRTLIDTIPNPIFVENTNLQFTEVNKAFEEIFGTKRSEVLGKTIYDFVPKEAADQVKRIDEELLIKHGTAIYESFIPNKERGISPVLVYRSSFGMPGNKPEGITALMIDISKQKEMEKTTLEALQKEKELNEMKTSFISMASHEFRTPLTTILASADLLEMYHNKWDEKNNISHFKKIQDAVQYITSLLDEVLTISRSDKGKIDFNPSVVDLNDFGLKVIEQVKLQATPLHNLIFNFNLPYQNVIADSKLLNHILTNLLINAIKFSPKGGDVVLTVEDDNDFIKFTIKDNGIGIPEEDKNKLFEPFFRGKNSGNIKGTGLGLSIVKRYVEIHHGELSFESKLGEGTEFFVKLNKVY